jgi:hypothetical protein
LAADDLAATLSGRISFHARDLFLRPSFLALRPSRRTLATSVDCRPSVFDFLASLALVYETADFGLNFK